MPSNCRVARERSRSGALPKRRRGHSRANVTRLGRNGFDTASAITAAGLRTPVTFGDGAGRKQLSAAATVTGPQGRINQSADYFFDSLYAVRVAGKVLSQDIQEANAK
jgi:hypothetical protein